MNATGPEAIKAELASLVDAVRRSDANRRSKAHRAAMLSKMNSDPVYREQHARRNREKLKVLHANPVFRERQVAGIKRSWADPEKRCKRLAAIASALATLQSKARKSASQKAAWANPETRAKILAALAAARLLRRLH